jgi:uncharacterized protein
MQKIKVTSRKYDGTLRDWYEAYLYAETNESVLLFSLPGLQYWHARRQAWLESQDGVIEIFLKRKWYNVVHIGEQISNTNLMYINIALPATLQDGVLEWIDLDLDYRVHMDNSVERLDQDEFDENAQRMGYPADLVEQVYVACREVEAGLAQRAFPFDYEDQVALYRQIKEML